jgi:5'(3')-deoxyribonucleotidase
MKTKVLDNFLNPKSNQAVRIALDLDGVLAETMDAWCKKANQEYGRALKLEDLTSWASWNILGISKDDFYRILDGVWSSWKEIPPTEPNIAGKVAKIRPYGQVDIVTGRSIRTINSVKKWLEYNKVEYDEFVRVRGWRDKVRLDYDIYIDDAPELMPLISKTLQSWGILYDRPWNRDVVDMPRVLKAKNWDVMPELLQKIKKQYGMQRKIEF